MTLSVQQTEQLRDELNQLKINFQKLETFTMGLSGVVKELADRQDGLAQTCMTINEVAANTSTLVGAMSKPMESDAASGSKG